MEVNRQQRKRALSPGVAWWLGSRSPARPALDDGTHSPGHQRLAARPSPCFRVPSCAWAWTALIALASWGLILEAPAQTWNGGGTNDNWSVGNNWVGASAPTNNGTANITMAGTTRLTPNIDTSWDMLGMTFSNTSGAFVLGGSQLTVRGSGIANNDGDIQTLNNAMVLGAAQTWNAASGNLVFGGTVANGGYLLTSSGSFDTTLSGIVSGTGGLTKSGTGTLTLSGANTFSGTLTLSAGTLAVGNDSATGSGGLTISASTTVQGSGAARAVGNVVTASGNFTIGGTSDLNFTSNINLSADRTVTVNNSGTTTFSGQLGQASGTPKFTKAGTGTLVLSASNTLADTITVSAGVLNVRNANALGTTGVGTTVSSGAALEIQGGIAVGAEALTLNGTGISSGGAMRNVSGNNSWAGAITLGSSSTINSDSGTLSLNGTLDTANSAYTVTFGGAGNIVSDGIISGSGSVAKVGAGMLTLSGNNANTYTGTTYANEGILFLNVNAVNGAIVDLLNVGDGIGGANADIVRWGANNQVASGAGSGIVLAKSGWLDMNNYSDTLKFASAEGGSITTGTGILTLANDLNVLVTATTATTISGNLALASNRKFTVNDGSAATDLDVSAVISGTGSLEKQNTGTLLLSGANTFSGGLKLTAGTTLIANDRAAGTGTLDLHGGTIQASGGARSLTNSVSVTANSAVGGADDITFSGDTTLTANRTLTTDNTGLTTFSGVMSGAGNSLTKAGAGTLALYGTNTFSGGTVINAGTVLINNNLSLGASGVAATINAGTLRATENITNTRNFTLGDVSSTIEVDATKTYTLSGVLSGSGGLTKNGTGTLELSGTSANTFSGAATVNVGTLILNKTAGLNAFAGTLTVGDGVGGANADVVRLSASNQIPNVTVTVNNSGLLDLNGYSDAIGALTMTGGSVTTGAGTLTLGGNVTGNADANTASIGGNLALGANRTFSIADGAAATDMSVSAVVSGAFALTKTGAGTMVLSGANTYTGATTISNGVLNIQNATALGTTAAGSTVISGAELQVQGGIAVSGEALTLNGSGVSSGGALRNVSGNNSWSGGVTLGATSTIASDSGTLTISGNMTNGGFLTTMTGAGSVTASGVISGTGGLTKSGAGTATLSGNNTFTGALAVNAGTLLLGASDRITDSVNVSLGGGTLASGGFNETVGTLTLASSSIIDFGNATSVVRFASSSGVSWTAGQTLIITNWTGSYAGGGPDQLFFGSAITALTGSQLGQIQFTDSSGNRQLANILSTGEVVPIPEPATVFGVGLVLALVLYRERRLVREWIVGRYAKLGQPVPHGVRRSGSRASGSR